MGKESSEIAYIDQLTARITGQPFRIHPGGSSVARKEPIYGAG